MKISESKAAVNLLVSQKIYPTYQHNGFTENETTLKCALSRFWYLVTPQHSKACLASNIPRFKLTKAPLERPKKA